MMIFCQLRARAGIACGQLLHLRDVADIRGAALPEITLSCPDEPGIWIIRAADVAAALTQCIPPEEIMLLGSSECYVHRMPVRRDRSRLIRSAAAFLILMLGSALGLCWFHSDVDMPSAQLRLYTLLTGDVPADAHLITVPYVIGVVLGVVIFYALPGRKEITPMEVKLMDYQEDMERARGRSADDA